jgi:hypothetical protein
MTVVLAALASGVLLLGGTALTVVVNYMLGQQKQSTEDRKELHNRITDLEKRELLRDDYIIALRQHIVDGKPPPPPPYPEGLTR